MMDICSLCIVCSQGCHQSILSWSSDIQSLTVFVTRWPRFAKSLCCIRMVLRFIREAIQHLSIQHCNKSSINTYSPIHRQTRVCSVGRYVMYLSVFNVSAAFAFTSFYG